MNLKDYKSVEVTLPVRYPGEHAESSATAAVKVDRDNQIVITIPGAKHANAFMELILTQSALGFSMNYQLPQPGIPGHDVEVTMEPSSVEAIPHEDLCMNHIPLQHRDGKEPWCRRCGLNKDYDEPRQIQFGHRPPQIGESFRRYQEGLNVVEEERVEGP